MQLNKYIVFFNWKTYLPGVFFYFDYLKRRKFWYLKITKSYYFENLYKNIYIFLPNVAKNLNINYFEKLLIRHFEKGLTFVLGMPFIFHLKTLNTLNV